MKDKSNCVAAKLLLASAEQAREAGRFDRVETLATQAMDLAREHGDVLASGHSIMLLAHVFYSGRGELEAAYSAACTAYGLLTAAGDTTLRLRALNTCANVRSAIGDDSAAMDIWRHALRSAKELDGSGIRCLLLFNIAETLLWCGEHQEAIQYLLQGVELAEWAPERPGQYTDCASELSRAHVLYADQFAEKGRIAEAREQLLRAASVLPPLDLSRWRMFSYLHYSSLQARVEVFSALGDMASARGTAAVLMLFARQDSRNRKAKAEALVGLGLLYRRSGLPQRAIHYVRLALSLQRSMGDEYERLRSMDRLANLHADCDEYAQALSLRKEMAASVAAEQAQRSAMSRRLAVIEREVEAQLADAQEKMAHAQRLAVIGRLIGQIHHALQAPIQRTRELCVLALRAHERSAAEAVSAPVPALGIPSLLSAISGSVDEAASLSRQLKTYAYRSSAMTTTVSIDTSLREVWASLGPHVGARPRELRVRGVTSLHVSADPQRLGVLLTLMLIELLKKQSQGSTDVAVVTAVLDTPAPGSVALVMDSQLTSEPHADPSALALIETLCKEIAAEMSATLSCTHPGGAILRCALLMPNAEDGAVDRKR